MDNLKRLQKYDQTMVISDLSINLHESFLLINIYIKTDIPLKRMEEKIVDTKIYIAGPIRNFNMMIKQQKNTTCLASLKTVGFIPPEIENEKLKVKLQNIMNYDITIRESDPVGVLVLTPYILVL